MQRGGLVIKKWFYNIRLRFIDRFLPAYVNAALRETIDELGRENEYWRTYAKGLKDGRPESIIIKNEVK